MTTQYKAYQALCHPAEDAVQRHVLDSLLIK